MEHKNFSLKMNTPWGMSDYRIQYARGFWEVKTPNHGGFMVSKGFAEKNLSKAAIKRGMEFGNYLCFEEDCDYAIIVFELMQYWDQIFTEDNPQKIYNQTLKSLSRWNSDYLQEMGITPEK